MMSSQSKDKDNNNNNRDRKSKSIRLSQKLRGLRDLRLRVSIEGGKPHVQQRRESIQESPQEEEEYRIVHTPDRPKRFISPVEAPTEDDCYDALRTWHHAAEQQRSGVSSYGTIQQQRSSGEPGTDDDGSRGSPFVPDPNDDAKTPKDEKWWELAHGEFKEVGGMNPFRQWEGDHQQQEATQTQSDTVGQSVKHDTAKGGRLQRVVAPPSLLTDFTGLLPKTYNASEAGQNDGFNGVSYPSKEEYTPSVYTPYTASQSPATPTPEMFPKAPTGTASGSPPPILTTTALETLLTRNIQHSRIIHSGNEHTLPPPGGRYFDVDEEYTPSNTNGGTSKSSTISGKPTATSISDQHIQRPKQSLEVPNPLGTNTVRGFLIPSLDFSSQTTQTLHSELLKLAHKQQQEQERGRGSGQSGESGQSGSTYSAFYSAFTSSRADTPDVRPPSRRGEQQQAGPSQGAPGTATGTGRGTGTPRPKKNGQQKRPPMTPPRGFLKERGPYIPPSGHPASRPSSSGTSGTSSFSLRPPPPPPKTPEKKPSFLLNGLDFNPSRPVPPTPNATPTKPGARMGTGMLGGLGGMGGHMGGHIAGAVSISSLSSLTGGGGSVLTPNNHDFSPSRPAPTPTKPKSTGSKGMMGGHIAGAISISSLSSLSSLTGSSGGAVITPPRPSPTATKPKRHPPPSSSPPPQPQFPSPSPSPDPHGLLTLPATVYSGNSKANVPLAMPVPVHVPVPSPLSKFNTTHSSSPGAKYGPSTSNRLPHSQWQGQGQEQTQQSSSDFSGYLHPRISDPFVDSPTSDVDTLDDRLSVAMVNGLYNEGQAQAWKETMAMMVQRKEDTERQMQKPKLIRVQSQRQAKERVQEQGRTQTQTQIQGQGQTRSQSESQGGIPLQTQTQTQPKVQKKIITASRTPPRTPPRTPRFQAYQPQPTPQTPSPRYLVFPPQAQSRPQAQPRSQPKSQSHSQPQPQQQQQLQPAPSPSPHPSPSLSLLRPIYPGAPFPQTQTITPPLSQTRTITPPRQHQPHPAFQKQSPMKNMKTEDKQIEQNGQQQRPLSGSTDSSDSSYDSLQFWKTKASTGTGTGTGVQQIPTEKKNIVGHLKEKGNDDGEDEGKGKEIKKERKGRYEFDDGDGDDSESETEVGAESGNGIGVASVDDYEHLIDQYAGGWRETMFFGEPEE